MLEHLPGKMKQIATNLQRCNLYYQNTKIQRRIRKIWKKKSIANFFLKTITKSFWKHRKNWQPILFITQKRKKPKKNQVYIKRNFKRGYIKYSKSKITQPVMFVREKNRGIENMYWLQENKCGEGQKQIPVAIDNGYKNKI